MSLTHPPLRVGIYPQEHDARFFQLLNHTRMTILPVSDIYTPNAEFIYLGFELMHNGTLDTVASLFTISEERMEAVRFTNALLPTKVAM